MKMKEYGRLKDIQRRVKMMDELFPTEVPVMFVLNGTVMEVECPECKGNPRGAYSHVCGKCRGIGRVLTAAGRSLMGFVVRHLEVTNANNGVPMQVAIKEAKQ